MESGKCMLFKRAMLRSSRLAAAVVGGALLLASCGGEVQQAPAAPALPPFTPRDAQLFDDGIEAKALGYEGSASAGSDDQLLPDRTQASDGVVRARVVTVTSKVEDSGKSLLIGFHVLETLAGHRAPAGDFTVVVPAKSSSAGLLGSMEGRLVGLTFVVFVRGFAAAGTAAERETDGELHFHLARDDKDEQNRVRAASLGPLH